MLKRACWLNPPGAVAAKGLAGHSVCQAPGSLALELCHGLPHNGRQPASSGDDHLDGLEGGTLVYMAIIGVGRVLVKMQDRVRPQWVDSAGGPLALAQRSAGRATMEPKGDENRQPKDKPNAETVKPREAWPEFHPPAHKGVDRHISQRRSSPEPASRPCAGEGSPGSAQCRQGSRRGQST